MSKTINLQEQFLDKLQHERRPVTLITTNGFHVSGLITGHDQYSIQMEVDGKQQLHYKHAISTVKEG